ncbi:MAG TPA: UPF0158 family protein [Pseudomonas sp.]|uniref:UPF0158 family protein n=1 Tax=Pseudomonas sp. TaxID=306 RepID=UPI0026035DE4|nr:UPF0158 family protein [Pseudomonas sp.]HSX87632.1 UPF0158 family protein [Pseudomonas sp.]
MMRSLKLELSRIEQAMLRQDDAEYFLDLETGGVLRMRDKTRPDAEEKYDVQPDRYLAIEPLPQEDNLAMRVAFLAGVHDIDAHVALSQALAGRKPIRTFDFLLESLPRAQRDWQVYQGQRLREHVLEWLQINGLEMLPPR